MKKIFLPLAILATLFVGAQEQEQEPPVNTTKSEYNRWSIDVNAGITKPIGPFTPRYTTATVTFPHVDAGVRYMLNNKFGLKLDFGYDRFTNKDDTPEFTTNYYRANLQGVINLGRVLNFEEWTRMINLQAHGGIGYGMMRSKDGFNGSDNMTNFIAGLTGQVKLTRKIALNADFSVVRDYRQTDAFDGMSDISHQTRGFHGTLYSATIGVSIYLGKHEEHADWFYKEKEDLEIDELKRKVAEIEDKMKDSDNDGVADYLDAEPNSPSGALVDTKGRETDKNKNGIPDNFENYVDKRIQDGGGNNKPNGGGNTDNPNNNELVRELINDGYVTAYFDFGKAQPTNVSTRGIDFILTYLRANPTASVEIYGHADEIGSTPYNDKLSLNRANNVKNVLVKAGVDEARIKTIGTGEDTSVDKDSETARNLVRRVTFKIK